MLKTEIEIIKTPSPRLKDSLLENPGFGSIFSDHMFSSVYREGRWQSPMVMPFGDISVSPALTCLHYGQAIFEGLKAFYSRDGRINIFRVDKYHERMNKSAKRLCIPDVPYDLFINGLKELVSLDSGWIPKKRGFSLYIRPFIFASDNFLGVRVSDTYRFFIITSPVGAYYKEGINPVSLTTPGEYVRAVKGGLGSAKTPANYAASLLPAEEAKKKGFTQVLWLDAIEHRYIEEVGTMNMFFVIGDELSTAPLAGTILPGVTRDSVTQLAKSWGVKVSERRLSMDEIMDAIASGTLKEAFASGTAAIVSPVGQLSYRGKEYPISDGKTGKLTERLYNEILQIQYGQKDDPFGWRIKIAD